MPKTLTSEEYAAGHGLRCPVCQSSNIVAGYPKDEVFGALRRKLRCDDCGATWTQHYELQGYLRLRAAEDTALQKFEDDITALARALRETLGQQARGG